MGRLRRRSGVHRRSGERVGSIWASESVELSQNLRTRTTWRAESGPKVGRNDDCAWPVDSTLLVLCAPPGDYRSLGGPSGAEISGALEGRKCALGRFYVTEDSPENYSIRRSRKNIYFSGRSWKCPSICPKTSRFLNSVSGWFCLPFCFESISIAKR